MKKLFAILMMVSSLAFAEASFDQIQGLIEQHQYQAAEKGLEVIIQNHPKSAKAFYAMAQAQAGLGNLEKAQKALDIATGLNPTLDFAPASSVASLKQAITPQVSKIEAVEESHFLRNLTFVGMLVLFTAAMYFLYSVYARKRDEEDKGNGPISSSGPKSPEPDSPIKPSARSYASSYVPPARPAYQGPTTRMSPAPATPAPASTPTTTVVNNNSGGNDMLTGVLIGNMLSSHHETTRVVEREVVREKPSRDSSWEDTPSRSSSRSSSWDDDSSSSSSKSSSWDDSSSSSRSSSWSSSSDSSSSSWDSGSSSSDSGSSSSWD